MQGPASFVILTAQQIIIAGTSVVGAGLFVYNGAEAKGNLIAQIVAPGVAHDPVGNNVVSVMNIGKWSAAGALLQHFGVDASGNVYIADNAGTTRILIANGGNAVWQQSEPAIIFYNSFGAVIQVVDPQRGGNFQYADTGSATQGTLIGSQVGKNTTDPILGLTQNAGINIIDPNFGDFLQIVGANILWGVGSTFTKQAADGVGIGSTNQGPFRSIAGPEQASQVGHPVLRLFGKSPDATRAAGIVISLTDPPTRQTSELLEIQGSEVVSKSTAWTSGSLTVEETWHALTPQNGWHNTGGTAVVAQYRLEPDNSVWLVGDISGGTITGGTQIFAMPAGYIPAHDFFTPVATGGSTASPTSVPNIAILASSSVQVNNLPTGTNRVAFNVKFKLDA